MAEQNILMRKASIRRVGRSPLPHLDEINANFAAKMEERFRPLFKAMTGAMILECEVRKLSRVLESIPVPAMLGLIGVRGSENSALVNVSSNLAYHIVDLRMGGDPAHAPAPTARSFTAIDTALCEAFVTTVVECFLIAVKAGLGVPLPGILRLSHVEQNITQVRLAPANADVLVITVSLDIGEAARQGDFDFILPLSVLDVMRAEAARVPGDATDLANRNFWRSHMIEAVSNARIDATGILHRVKMSLAQIDALAVGDIVPVPPKAHKQVEVTLARPNDTITFGQAQLGMIDGRKVLKLTEPPNGEVMQHLAGSLADHPNRDAARSPP